MKRAPYVRTAGFAAFVAYENRGEKALERMLGIDRPRRRGHWGRRTGPETHGPSTFLIHFFVANDRGDGTKTLCLAQRVTCAVKRCAASVVESEMCEFCWRTVLSERL